MKLYQYVHLLTLAISYGTHTEAFTIIPLVASQRLSIRGANGMNTNTNNFPILIQEKETPSSSTSSTSLYSTTNPNPSKSTTSTSASANSNSNVTSNLISNLAVIALKLRLLSHSGVSCNVSASPRSLLLTSTVGPVTVKGRGWSSPLGLTCRAIEANVSECHLDMTAVVQKRKLVLHTPAVGKAMVALDNQDFGNFLTHPLLEGQIPRISIGDEHERFEFDNKNVVIDDENGCVVFYGTCGGESWRCVLSKAVDDGGQNAAIEVTHIASDSNDDSNDDDIDVDIDIAAMSMELTMVITDFFNNLVFELDGTYLSFQDMKVHKTKDQQSQILISLGITVRKFPSPGVAF